MTGQLTLTVLRPIVGEVTSVRENGRWVCSDKLFQEILDITPLPDGYYPDRDLTLAYYIANRYHGTVTDTRPKQETKDDPNIIY